MKYFSLLAVLTMLVLLSFTGCQKDYPEVVNKNYCDTLISHDTIRIADTIRIHDTVATVPLTKTQILAQKDWIVDEVSRNLYGSNSHYVRNGINTTGTNYSNMRFHFNTDGSGNYTDENSGYHTMTWSFSPDQKNMQLIISPPYAQTFNWNIVEVKDNFLYSTTQQGTDILITARFIQLP